jgi:signal transduction histidine kinase
VLQPYLGFQIGVDAIRMVAEGLSNVRRHTSSPRVTIGMACHREHFILCIENDGVVETTPAPFTPLSLTERAAALGGRVSVAGTATGSTAVIIDIPV